MHLDWQLPGWAVALAAAAAVTAAHWSLRQYRATEPPPGRLLAALLALRAAVLLGLAVALAGPSLLNLRETSRPGEVVILVEDSASMDAADGAGGRRRWERALGLAASAESLLAAVVPAPAVTLLRGNGLEAPRPLRGQREEPPAAVGTDLGALVREVGGRWAGRPLRAVVLLSDGNETARQPGGEAPLPAGGWQLVTVGVGDPVGPPDLAVQDVRHPETVFAGERLAVEVTVGGRWPAAAPGGEVSARLFEDGRELARAAAPPPGPDGIVALELVFEPAEPGPKVYRVEIAGPANERHLDNNEASLAVDVRRRRSRLLLLAGRPDWNVRFLALAAAQESRLELSVLRPGPGGPLLAGPQGETAPWVAPRDAAGWREWDGFVLAGWRPELAGVDWAALASAVGAGSGLLVLPGTPDEAPWSGPTRPLVPLPPALAPVLPVSPQPEGWRRADWLPAETAAAEHAVLAGVTQGVPPEQGLAGGLLPPLEAVAAVRPGGGALVLLQARPRGGEQPPQPLLVLGEHGRGRVTWFGGFPAWELAFWESPLSRPDAPHPGRQLLRNLLVWTASGDRTEGPALVGTRQTYQVGERVRLEAVWRDLRGLPVVDRDLAVRVEPLDEGASFSPRTFALAPVPERPGTGEAVLPPLPPGSYRVTPLGLGDPALEGAPMPLVVSATSLEAGQVRQDGRRLRRLAAALGGRHVAGQEAEAERTLGEALAVVPTHGDVRSERSRLDLASGWPPLAALILLLGAEWLLRRSRGML